MQTISQEFKDIILGPGSKQHGALVKVYDRTGALLLLTFDDTAYTGEPALSWEVNIDPDADARRSLTLTIPNQDGKYSQDELNPDVWTFAENNIIDVDGGYKLADGTFELKHVFYGYVDRATMSTTAEGMPTVVVTARSTEKKALQSKFDVTTTYTDTPSESVDFAKSTNGATATASTNVASGDPLQTKGKIILTQGYKTVLGVRTSIPVTGDITPIIDGQTGATSYPYAVTLMGVILPGEGFQFRQSEPGLTLLEVTCRLDLWTSETVSSITPRLGPNTTCSSLKTSTDGFTWTTQPTAGVTSPLTTRYVEMTVQAIAVNGEAIVSVGEIEVIAGGAYPASNAIDGDNFTSWRPKTTDLDRILTVNFGQSRTWNVAYVQTGVNPLDVWSGVKFKLLNGDTGAVLDDKTDQYYTGLVECIPASAVTCSSIKVQILAATGLVAVRTIEVYSITATNTVTFLLSDMATQAGIPVAQQQIAVSKLYRANMTGEIGDDYLKHQREVVDAVAWELFGEPVAGKTVGKFFRYDPNNPVITYKAGEANITSLSKNPNGEGIFNWIVVRSEQNDKTIISTTSDDSLGSPTSTQRLGKRVRVVQDNTILTQKAADQRALLELWRNTKWRAPVSMEHATANPAHEANDVVWVEEDNTKTKAAYLLKAFRLNYTPEAFSMSGEFMPVG